MMTQAPLPSWKLLFRALFLRSRKTPDELLAPWINGKEVAGWLSRSAWSLALIAEWRKRITCKESIVIWLPSYFCNGSLTPLRHCAGVTLVFYPITDQMLPDLIRCRQMAAIQPPDICIIVHYFGRPMMQKGITDLCTVHKAWLVEDAAHVLRPVKGIGTTGDFVLYSPHKLMPIHDGAVLVVRGAGPARLEETLSQFGDPSGWPDQLSQLQNQMRGLIKKSGNEAVKWVCKRILQKAGLVLKPPRYLQFEENTEQPVHTALVEPRPAKLSMKLLGAGLIGQLNEAVRRRQRNQLILDELIQGLNIRTIVPGRPLNREWTPYLAMYKFQQGEAKTFYDTMCNKAMPVSTWPDLPPEVIRNKKEFPETWALRHTRVYLALHQSIPISKVISKLSSQEVADNPDKSIQVRWDDATEQQWYQLLLKTGKTNLLQDYAYGLAKSVKDGWHTSRAVFYKDDEPIAYMQVLQKKILRLFTVNRVNRAPLTLRELTKSEETFVYRILASLGNYWKRQVLLTAPEMNVSGSALLLLQRLKFRQFSLHPWESAWIDLELPEEQIRKNLDGKWRNMLNFSEKAGLALETRQDENLFNWLMDKYEELMQEKKFGGMTRDFMSYLHQHLIREKRMIVLRASLNQEHVAGICVVRHGSSATYLIGWNGLSGRNLKANQFLLWNAIVLLKKEGVKYFDLGGINEESVPGISAFKKGVNGDFYELVGEYIKW